MVSMLEFSVEDYSNKNSPLSVDISSPGPSSGPNSGGGSLSPQSSPKPNSLNPFKRPGEPITAESPALKRARSVCISIIFFYLQC